jgi:hypothetical protein
MFMYFGNILCFERHSEVKFGAKDLTDNVVNRILGY